MDQKYVSDINGHSYCRRCITFNGKNAPPYEVNSDNSEYKIDYNLSKEQEYISNQTLYAIKNKRNVLIHAVCGAGKTELIFKSVSYIMSLKKQVGFCVPRRDVVIDLFPRFKTAYPHKKIVAVYGGKNEDLCGDIVLLTTHQLYRYPSYFDLLIIDETDAFPYQGDFVLNVFFKKAIKGNYIMLSATPTPEMIRLIDDGGVYLTLNKRYHGHPLPVPIIKIKPFLKWLYLIKYTVGFIKKGKPVLVFCSSIDETYRLYIFMSIFIKGGNYVSSKTTSRDEIIKGFKERKYRYLLSTTLLERGVTIKDLQVIVFNAHNPIFDQKTLIQISGRVGRKSDAYEGEVIFLSDYKTEDMEKAIQEIITANR